MGKAGRGVSTVLVYDKKNRERFKKKTTYKRFKTTTVDE